MRNAEIIAGAMLCAFAAAPAAACPPSVPRTPEQEQAFSHHARQSAAARYRGASEIVYGVVTRSAREGGIARFRIIHAYKGSLRPGSTINVISVDVLTLSPPVCPVPGPVLVERGRYGVLAFRGERPALDFIDVCTLDYWFRNRWIRRQSPPRPLYNGGSGTFCAVYDYRPIAGME